MIFTKRQVVGLDSPTIHGSKRMVKDLGRSSQLPIKLDRMGWKAILRELFIMLMIAACTIAMIAYLGTYFTN